MTATRTALARAVAPTAAAVDRVRDVRGLDVFTTSEEAGLALFETVQGFVAHRAAVPEALGRALALDPGLVSAHVFAGLASCLLGRRDVMPVARAAHRAATSSLAERPSTPRERQLTLALGAWCEGDPMRAAGTLERLLEELPLDLFALKAHHAACFYLGESAAMRRTVERALPAWRREESPGLGAVLGCHAFALTETGDPAQAVGVAAESERASAVRAEPDPWGKHAAVHALQARGRTQDALERATSMESDLAGASNFAGHVRWHEAMLRIERGELERALALHDVAIAIYPPRDYRDVVNVSTLLYRLEREGLDVGDRWRAPADTAETMLGDHGSSFADAHYVLALVGAQRGTVVDRYLASMEAVARTGHGHAAELARDIGLEVGRSIAVLGSEPDRSAEILARLGPGLSRLGGSLAQRQIFRWLRDDAARRALQRGASS